MLFATWYLPMGMLIGLASAAPVGPVNLLVIQRALSRSTASALTVGLGGALGDGLFAIVAAFGLGAVTGMLDAHDTVLRIVGGLVMLGFSIVVWRAAPRLGGASVTSGRRVALLAFTMTLTNPATLLFFFGSFGAIGFVGIGHDTAPHRINAALIVTGVLAGSMLWWLFVTTLARRLRDRIADRHLIILNHATAVALALFGVAAIVAGVSPK